jgi:hypothetical protein
VTDTSSQGESFGFDAIVGLTLKVGSLADSLSERDRREREWRRGLIPVDWPLVGAGTFPSAGNLVIDLGMPPESQVWLLRRLYVGGQTRATAAAGGADVFVSPLPSLSIAVDAPAANQVDFTSVLPNQAFYTSRQVVVRNHEHIYVMVSGGTVGQIYMASGAVEAYSEAAYRSVFEL